MRWMRAGLLGCAVVFSASLLLARTHPFGNAALYGTEAAEPAILEDSSVPIEVRAVLVAKCADCHSMRVQLPLYDRVASRFAPASWLMERDIVEGRKHLNLSLWSNYTADERQSLEGLIVEEVKKGDMPPMQYRMIHLNARVTAGDVAALKRWTRPMPVVEGALIGQAGGEGDPARGEALFDKRCTGCHSLDQNREGPRLRNVYGRTSGSVADYDYSGALKKAAIAWNDASLDRWLAGSDALVPGNNMDFEVDNAQDRRDLISFLRKSAGK